MENSAIKIETNNRLWNTLIPVPIRQIELEPRTILFSASSGRASGSAYAVPNRTSALYRVLFWMIYRRGAFVVASSISASSLFFFVSSRFESDALDHRQRLSSLRSLRHTRLVLPFSSFPFSPISTVAPSDKLLSLPLFSPLGCDRSTAHFDVRPILKRAKRR